MQSNFEGRSFGRDITNMQQPTMEQYKQVISMANFNICF